MKDSFLLALVMDGARGIIRMPSTSVCAALTPPDQCSVPLSNVPVSLFSSFDFYTFSCTFVVIVNVLGFCCFSRIHCLCFFFF